jgi:hypothetical protein
MTSRRVGLHASTMPTHVVAHLIGGKLVAGSCKLEEMDKQDKPLA